MGSKKIKKAKQTGEAGMHGVHAHAATNRKSAAQTEGQFAKDPKGRTGQFQGAGNPPLIKK